MKRLILLLAFPLSFMACGGGPVTPEVKAGPPIAGLQMSGLWYSEQFGDMNLVHTGRSVRGKYEDPRGPDHNGTIKGTIEGDILRIEWIKRGNAKAAILPIRGKAWLRITKGGATMKGRWGYEASDTDGGPWEAEKSKQTDY